MAEAPPQGALDPEQSESAAYRREQKQRRILTERRRQQYALAAVIGVFSGLIAVVFQWSIYGIETGRTMLLEFVRTTPVPDYVVLPVLCAALGLGAGWLTTRFAPEAAGSGIPHVKAVLLRLRPFRWLRVIGVKLVGGLMALGAGLSLGREGPTVQMGAAVAEGLARKLHVSKRAESQLVSAGAGAGLSAAFNAPLSGFFFVIEELQRELSPLTYGTALVASVVGNVIARLMTGQLPSFVVGSHPTPPLSALPVALVIGLVCGLIGLLFNRGLIGSLTVFQKIPKLKPKHRPALMGLIGGLILVWMPLAAGGGHHAAEMVISGEFNGMQFLPFLFWLLVLKFLFTAFSYGSGAPGGIFAPMLVIGALVGQLCGQLSIAAFPSIGIEASAMAMIGMAALFSASVRAPLTGVILIMEMTANYDLLLFLLLACFTAAVTSEALRGKPIYEELLARDLRRDPDIEIHEDEPVLEDLVVEHGSPVESQALKDVGLPTGCLIVTLKRHGSEIVPSGQTVLQRGDEVTVVIAGAALKKMAEIVDQFRSSH